MPVDSQRMETDMPANTMGRTEPESDATPASVEAGSPRRPGGRQPGAGRKPTHGAAIMRKTLRVLTTKRLDGRSFAGASGAPDGTPEQYGVGAGVPIP